MKDPNLIKVVLIIAGIVIGLLLLAIDFKKKK